MWHKRLDYVSNERIKRLVKDGLITNLNFTNTKECQDCIKDKQTKNTKKRATRSIQPLEIIHTNVCGHF